MVKVAIAQKFTDSLLDYQEKTESCLRAMESADKRLANTRWDIEGFVEQAAEIEADVRTEIDAFADPETGKYPPDLSNADKRAAAAKSQLSVHEEYVEIKAKEREARSALVDAQLQFDATRRSLRFYQDCMANYRAILTALGGVE